MYGRTKVTCQNHISIWHGVHMALATIIKFFCFSYMELRGDKYDTKVESLWHLLKYNSMCANALNPISHNSSLMYIWLQLTRGKTICQYRLLVYCPTRNYVIFTLPLPSLNEHSKLLNMAWQYLYKFRSFDVLKIKWEQGTLKS